MRLQQAYDVQREKRSARSTSSSVILVEPELTVSSVGRWKNRKLMKIKINTMTMESSNQPTSPNKLQILTDNIGKIIRGKEKEVKYVITALLSRGHILLEDNPGAGKTVLAKTLAQSISGGL